MTTLPAPNDPTYIREDGAAPLNAALSRTYTINWELAFYAVILVLAIFTRFVNLGDRVMSHDESLHTKYSWDLFAKGIYLHTPLMHGPVLFHMTALDYFLFGDSDFSARIYPAVLGVIMVLMPPLLFRRWLKPYGAMAASVFILISPMLLYHHRYIREDTPAIFFTILMVYAMFAYVDGIRPRQVFHLLLLSAAMLLNLASKETAFMYVLIFVLFAGLIVVFNMGQGWLRGELSKAAGWTLIGTLVLPLAGIGSTVLLVVIDLRNKLPVEGITLWEGATLSQDALLMSATILIGVPMALFISLGALFVYRVLWAGLLHQPITPLVREIGRRGDSWLRIVLVGVLMGTTAALIMTNFLSILTPESIRQSQEAWATYETNLATLPPPVEGGAPAIPPPSQMHPTDMITRLVFWIALLVFSLTFILLATAAVRFYRLPQVPWADIMAIIAIAAAVCLVLIFVEERSRIVKENNPPVFDNMWIFGSWVVAILAIAGIAFLRVRTTFWQEMRRYPMFDILILLATLILPWSAALPIYQAGYPLDGGFSDPNLVSACILGLIPFVAVSAAAGLAWRPGVWVLCVGVFYAIFAFFYTTVFTNPEGVFTGIVGSLGYWLEQQGVRRGSQPQYYYMIIQLPIYEFLPVIGSALAGVVGLGAFWKFRAGRTREALNAAAEGGEALHTRTTSFMKHAPLAEEALSEDAENLKHDAESSAVDLEQLAQDGAAIPLVGEAYRLWGEKEKEKPKRGEGLLGTEVIAHVVNIPAEEMAKPHFLTFVGYWALLILLALTLSGEKMPWLTTHITLPMCLLTGWYTGLLLEKVNWTTFWRGTWALVILVPILIVGVVSILSPFVTGNSPFDQLALANQSRTLTWLGTILLSGVLVYAIYRLWRGAGTGQMIRVGMIGVITLLGFVTARAAFMAAYQNYDSAREFMVYAHSAPSNKEILNDLEYISRRTTDGLKLSMAYDNLVSWPGSWYFRNFPNGRYIGEADNVGDIEQHVAIVVGEANARKIEPLLGNKYYKRSYVRLWWPMQEYFGLTLKRVDDALGDGQMRQAMWDIWLNRDYTRYTQAYQRMTGDTNTKFEEDTWPVSDRVVLFIRKDVAAQIWDFGVGGAEVGGLPADQFANRRCDTCTAEIILRNPTSPMLNPRGVATDRQGNLYIADSQNARILIYNEFGVLQRQFGTATVTNAQNALPEIGTFREPWGIAVANDGTIFVADTWNHRVQVFAPDGTPLRTWGTFGQADASAPASVANPQAFYGPRAIAVDAKNHVYVADTGNMRIRVYTGEGSFLYDIGMKGQQAGQMYEPVGVAVNNRTEELFVANTWNKRIDVFTLGGMHLRSWEVQGWYATTPTADSGNRPYLALDDTGTYLLVTDPDAGRVLVYDTLGTPVLSFGRSGVAPFESGNEFGALGGITVDMQGRIYLADAGGARVLRFPLARLPGLVRPVSGLFPPTETTPEAASPTPDDF
ncbi:MAG TPA: TIGR03663 family protein [Aggregatilineales bacterium]|nr:TIGR03663 family protein [Anaerolineales bacterium]HRE48714.1 TIGR03663 family protein [Aggregatilineales bacterium]